MYNLNVSENISKKKRDATESATKKKRGTIISIGSGADNSSESDFSENDLVQETEKRLKQHTERKERQNVLQPKKEQQQKEEGKKQQHIDGEEEKDEDIQHTEEEKQKEWQDYLDEINCYEDDCLGMFVHELWL